MKHFNQKLFNFHPLGGSTSKITVSVFIVYLFSVFIFLPTTVFGAAVIQASLQPSFEANLTNSIILQTGRGNPVFSRASTAYVQDWENLFRQAKSGEVRFEGARRVENLLSSTEDFSTVWVQTSLTVTANQIASPIGTNTADLFTTSGVGGQRVTQGSIVVNGTAVTYSVWIKGGTATNAKLLIYDGTAGATRIGQQVTLSTSWQRFSVTATNLVSGNNHYFYIYIDENVANGAGATAYVWGAQAENVTGQSNQNPSDYVSKGVLSSPYHGANVDGVKYFDRQNGNTVLSNVVTANTGAKISTNTLRGYLAEGARTNLALYSEQFDNAAWSQHAEGLTVSANNVVAPDGSMTAEKLVETADTTLHRRGQSIASSAGTLRRFSVYVKSAGRTKARGWSWAGGDTSQQTFNLSTVTATGGLNPTIQSVGNGWYRCSFDIPSANSTTVVFGPVDDTHVSTDAYLGDGSSGIYVWGAQIESAPFESSYIPTTSASATRSGDLLAYPTSGNIGEGAFSLYMEMNRKNNNGDSYPSKSPIQIGSYASNSMINFGGYSGTNLSLLVDFGTVWDVASNPFSITYNTPTKIALRLANNLTTFSSFKNGAKSADAVSGNAKTLNWAGSPSYIYIANSGTVDANQSINVKNVKIWPRALTDAQLTGMTKNTEYFSLQSIAPKTTIKTPPKSGLVGYWNFNDGAGAKAGDISGNGNTATLVGSPSWITGKLGKALNFNGSTNYATAGSSSSLNLSDTITISVWVKSPDWHPTASWRAIVDKSSYGIYVWPSSNILRFQLVLATTGIVTVDSGVLNTNQWYHVVGTYDKNAGANNFKIYVNGVLHDSSTQSNSIVAGNALNIGLYSGSYFNGIMDDLRIYNRALSVAEIQQLYKQNATQVNTSQNNFLTNGLVGLWSFNGKDMNWGTNKALDRSGNGNDGRLMNMSTTSSPTPGKIGSALNFRGISSGSYVSLGTSAILNPSNFTISAWIYPATTTVSYGYIYSNARDCCGTYNGIDLQYTNGVVVGGIWNGTAAYVYSTNQGTDIKWRHIVFSYDGAVLRVYVNGVLSNSANSTLGVGSPASYSTSIGGMGVAPGTYTFNGKIDDVRLYNRALSATEAKQLYNLGR